MATERDFKEKFPNPPLDEVAYEIRFPSLLRIEQEIYEFQDKIREEFPIVNTSIVGVRSTSGSIIPQNAWEFINEDEQLIVKVRNNSLALISKKYKSFDEFFPRIKSCTKLILDTYEIPYASRVGLRYIDNYIFEQNGEILFDNYKKYFIPLFNVEKIQLEDIINHNIQIRRQMGEHFLTLRTVFFKDDVDTYHYVLDTDSYHESKKIVRETIFDIVNELHDNVIKEWYNVITDDFIEFLRKGG